MHFRSAAFWLFTAAVCVAPAKEARLSPAKTRHIEQVVAAGMKRMRIPGLSVAIGVKRSVSWAEGFGTADMENSVPATADTMFRLGSICKPITATAVMQLVEKRKIELDAPVQRYVPEFPEKQWPLRVRQLLSHVGGIRHYRDLGEINSTRHYTDAIEPLRTFWQDPLLFEPGTQYSYSSYGYALLGAAVERAAGLNFMTYVRDNIFRPAQMARIRTDDVYDIIPHRARGYRLATGGTLENCALADTSNKIPAGGMISTAGDLVKFALALNSGVLVSKETLGQMFAPQRLADGEYTGYGLGWSVFQRDGARWVAHSGAQQGVSTFLVLVPGKDVSVSVMANLEGADLSGLAAEIVHLILD